MTQSISFFIANQYSYNSRLQVKNASLNFTVYQIDYSYGKKDSKSTGLS